MDVFLVLVSLNSKRIEEGHLNNSVLIKSRWTREKQRRKILNFKGNPHTHTHSFCIYQNYLFIFVKVQIRFQFKFTVWAKQWIQSVSRISSEQEIWLKIWKVIAGRVRSSMISTRHNLPFYFTFSSHNTQNKRC